MPKEDRRIIFDYSETYNAISNLATKRDNVPSIIEGAIKKVEQDGLNSNQINIFVENPHNGDKAMIGYSRDVIAAALMVYCRGCGIPLPKKAGKTILIEKNTVTLRVLI